MLEGMRFATAGLERAADRADRLEARRSFEALLQRELGVTFVAPLLPNAPALVGGRQSLRFLTLAEDGGAGLYRVDARRSRRAAARRRWSRRGGGSAACERSTRHALLWCRGSATCASPISAAPRPTTRRNGTNSWNGPLYPPTLVRIDLDSGDGLAQPPLVVRLWAAPG